MSVLVVIALISAWLRWYTFTYQILPGQIVIARGLIKRTRRSIPAERIQDVSIKQGPLSRVIGIAEVRIETGSGEVDEGRLVSVSLSEAHNLREVIRSIRGGGNGVEASTQDGTADTEAVLFQMGLPRLLFSGLFNFSLVWIAAIFGALQYLEQALGYDWDRWREVVGVAEQTLQSQLNGTVLLGVAGVAVALGLLAGVTRTVLQDFGFTLTCDDARFRYRRGLLTRNEVVVAKRQIQLGLVERGAVSGGLGWSALKVQTLGGGDQASGRQELAPFARSHELAPIIALAGLPPFDRSELKAVSGWHAVRGLFGMVLVPTVVVLFATLFYPIALLLLVAVPVLLAVALLRRRRHRYGLAATSVQVTRGVLVQRDWTVPYGNIQAVSVRRGPFQRLVGIATVRVDTAGGSGINGPHVHDIEEARAEALVRDLTRRVQALRDATDTDPA
ncbi:MAG: PH domain-containing protein [Brevundimonas sp.]|uniref:PH domain-containing protein n=1 Tax=Brevundimonas sp. TaxID=1871086 RepID=UPI002AB81A6B|nr:PH domain-containing protein [Brevundimonas sp.]MDZ4110348.1 PH domain-containing protein [Brevundimonas sp.]